MVAENQEEKDINIKQNSSAWLERQNHNLKVVGSNPTFATY